MEYPVLRPIDVFPVDVQGERVLCLRDPEGHSPGLVLLHPAAIWVVARLDGKHSLSDIQADLMQKTGQTVELSQLEHLVADLDRQLMLDSPHFHSVRAATDQAFRQAPVRPLAHGGRAYDSDPATLRATLDGYLSVTSAEPAPGHLRALISPHIDYGRGGPAYGVAYHELRRTDPFDLFVILGTSHAATRRLFAGTLKHFDTPLGQVDTDQEFMTRLMASYRISMLDDELVHRNEHAIELQTVFIKHLYPQARIAPILVGSFHGMIGAGVSPWEISAVRDFVEALRATEATMGRRTCYIAAADLAHIGTRFGDPEPASAELMAWVAAEDGRSLQEAAAVRPEGWFARSAEEGDRRRICGLSPIYTLLRVLAPEGLEGRLLRYQQCNEPTGSNNVTIASVAYYEKNV